MSTTRSFFGRSKSDKPEAVTTAPESSTSDRVPVEVARFVTQFLIGRPLEPMSSISDGQRFREDTLEVSYFNDTFMSVRFPTSGYTQLVPWTAVATLIIK